MTLELKISKAKIMKTVIDALAISNNDIYIKIDENEGFRAQAKGSGSHILTDTHLDVGIFDTFNVSGSMVLHVDLVGFGNFIKLAKSNDVLIIRYNEEKEELELILESSNMKRSASLRLLENKGDQESNYRFMNILGREFHSNSKFDASYLIEAIKVATFGEGGVEITHDKTGIRIVVSAEFSSTTAEAKIIYDEENFKDINIHTGIAKVNNAMIELPEKHIANFDLEVLKSIPKTIKAGENITFSMMNEGPLRIVSTLEEGQGRIAIALSPIVKREMQ